LGVAWALAAVPELQAQRDVLDAWDFLSDRVDLPFVVELSRAIRATAVATYRGSSLSNGVFALKQRIERDGG
jgi:hypothetical protein